MLKGNNCIFDFLKIENALNACVSNRGTPMCQTEGHADSQTDNKRSITSAANVGGNGGVLAGSIKVKIKKTQIKYNSISHVTLLSH